MIKFPFIHHHKRPSIRVEEHFTDIHGLPVEDLYSRYYLDNENVVKAFNEAVEDIRKIGIRHYPRSILRLYMAQFTSYLNTFETYQRAFFENYINIKGDGKALADDFLRSSEIYFSRSNTILGQISNEITRQEASLAIKIGWGAIILACMLFPVPYLFQPKAEPDARYYQRIQKDSLQILQYQMFIKKQKAADTLKKKQVVTDRS